MITLYLSGAIRSGIQEDSQWREEIVNGLAPMFRDGIVRVISPLGGKYLNRETGQWTVCGIPASPQFITKADFWAIDHSDIILANFTALKDNHPMVGTLCEWGRATARGALCYAIWPPDIEQVRQNISPFIHQTAAHLFPDHHAALSHLRHYLYVLAGVAPFPVRELPDDAEGALLWWLPDDAFIKV